MLQQIIPFSFIVANFCVTVCYAEPGKGAQSSESDTSAPRRHPPHPIVEHFACSDYCPGPKEKYLVKVYQGVTDPEECLNLGGRPATYTGWGTKRICIAEEKTKDIAPR